MYKKPYKINLSTHFFKLLQFLIDVVNFYLENRFLNCENKKNFAIDNSVFI